MKTFIHRMTILSTVLIFFLTVGVNAQPAQVPGSTGGGKPWWKKALVDAGGALGGAGSVGSLINVGSITPAGWVAIGGGAILGGGSASVAYSSESSAVEHAEAAAVESGKSAMNSGNSRMSNKSRTSDNQNDHIGQLHNQIIADYFDKHSTYNRNTFYDFVISDGRVYPKGITPILTKKDYNQIVQESIYLRIPNDNDKIIEFILKYLPDNVNTQKFRDYLILLLNSNTQDSFNANLDYAEGKVRSENDLSDYDSFLMDCFFSTARNSADFWD
ncbi:hypothetical protein [uncultured Dokdonia sp.]|uniref:hypothetical protein n=1 Tax=uncultured Dokdonia sp. TaxID=575653 RepID=UPI002624FF82|nr:hypothetical protein [uncultured Dokdonia sp.]